MTTNVRVVNVTILTLIVIKYVASYVPITSQNTIYCRDEPELANNSILVILFG